MVTGVRVTLHIVWLRLPVYFLFWGDKEKEPLDVLLLLTRDAPIMIRFRWCERICARYLPNLPGFTIARPHKREITPRNCVPTDSLDLKILTDFPCWSGLGAETRSFLQVLVINATHFRTADQCKHAQSNPFWLLPLLHISPDGRNTFRCAFATVCSLIILQLP